MSSNPDASILVGLLEKLRAAILDESSKGTLQLEESRNTGFNPRDSITYFVGSAKLANGETRTYVASGNHQPLVDSYRKLSREGGTLLLSPRWTKILQVSEVASPETLWAVFLFHFNTPGELADGRVLGSALSASVWAIESCLDAFEDTDPPESSPKSTAMAETTPTVDVADRLRELRRLIRESPDAVAIRGTLHKMNLQGTPANRRYNCAAVEEVRTLATELYVKADAICAPDFRPLMENVVMATDRQWDLAVASARRLSPLPAAPDPKAEPADKVKSDKISNRRARDPVRLEQDAKDYLEAAEDAGERITVRELQEKLKLSSTSQVSKLQSWKDYMNRAGPRKRKPRIHTTDAMERYADSVDTLSTGKRSDRTNSSRSPLQNDQ